MKRRERYLRTNQRNALDRAFRRSPNYPERLERVKNDVAKMAEQVIVDMMFKQQPTQYHEKS